MRNLARCRVQFCMDTGGMMSQESNCSHVAVSYTWEEYSDGDLWQAGLCINCREDLFRRVSNKVYGEWQVAP